VLVRCLGVLALQTESAGCLPKPGKRRMLLGMVRMWGRLFVLGYVVAACSGEARKGEPSPATDARPSGRKPNTIDIGKIAFANDCLIAFDPGDSRILASVLVRGRYKRPDGKQFEDFTVYNLMCSETEGWKCSGTKLDLGHADNAGAERVIGWGQLVSIVGAKAITVQNGFAVISWGVNTITIDAANGTFEHRDTSGSGKATCESPLDRH
jgi:hypothetical protein